MAYHAYIKKNVFIIGFIREFLNVETQFMRSILQTK